MSGRPTSDIETDLTATVATLTELEIERDRIDALRPLDESGEPVPWADLVALWNTVHHADWVSYESDRGIRALINRLSKVRAT